jgi:hypothetical protein
LQQEQIFIPTSQISRLWLPSPGACKGKVNIYWENWIHGFLRPPNCQWSLWYEKSSFQIPSFDCFLRFPINLLENIKEYRSNCGLIDDGVRIVCVSTASFMSQILLPHMKCSKWNYGCEFGTFFVLIVQNSQSVNARNLLYPECRMTDAVDSKAASKYIVLLYQ